MSRILEHYKQLEGLWMQLEFNGMDTFFMTIQNKKGHKIAYPLPSVTYPHDMAKIEEGSSSQPPSVTHMDWIDFNQYTLTLSLFELSTASLVIFILKRSFCYLYLEKLVSYICKVWYLFS